MLYKISNDQIEISVDTKGAELKSIKSQKDGLEFLWQGNPEYWKDRSLILFPIIGGLPDDKYIYKDKEYNMNSHGFAKTSNFELYSKSEDELVFKLISSKETLDIFPFKFEFYVLYKIVEKQLIHGLKVVNVDEDEMIFTVGAHPGFNCPLYENENRESYKLVFEKPEVVSKRLKKGKLLTGERRPFMDGENEKVLKYEMFYDGAVILDSLVSKSLSIVNSENDRVITVEFEGFPYMGIWAAANDAPYVCIEPWYGIDSTDGDDYDIEKKEGMLRLDAGKEFECSYKMIFE